MSKDNQSTDSQNQSEDQHLFSLFNIQANPADYIDSLVHGVLDKSQTEWLNRLIEEDSDLQKLLEQSQRDKAEMQNMKMEFASEDLIEKASRRVTERKLKSGRRWKRYFQTTGAIAASALVCLLGFQIYLSSLSAPTHGIHILGQRDVQAESLGQIRTAVFNHSDGSEILNVPMEIRLSDRSGEQSPITLASFETGQDMPAFHWPDWPAGKYSLDVIATVDGKTETYSRALKLKREFKMMLSTDKPLYQPGQTIHIRTVSLANSTLKPVADQNAIFRIKDPKNNVIFREVVRTSQFGIAATDCPLASLVNLGKYTIEVELGDTRSEKSVKVSEYVLPKFKVGLGLDKPFYLPGERVKVELDANYFFGKPVVGGKVDLFINEAVASVGLSSKFKNSLPKKLKTNDDGKAKFEMTLPRTLVGKQQSGGKANLKLTARITDSAGQATTQQSRIVVSNAPIQIEVIPESNFGQVNVDNIVYIYTATADGRPTRSKVQVNKEKTLETNELGIGILKVKPKPGGTPLKVVATDAATGKSVTRNVTLYTSNTPSKFLLRTDRIVYQAGDSMSITAIGGGVEPVFVDLIQNGQTVLTKRLDIDEQSEEPKEAGTSPRKGELVFDIPASISGTIQLVAYRFNSSGVPVRVHRMIHVKQANDLKIDVALDSSEYRPGDQAKLKFTVTGPDGKPIQSAIGLSIVDEALFSVVEKNFDLETLFFLIEKELLKPVYTIYNNWSPSKPGEIPEDDWVQFNHGMFARAANKTWERNQSESIENTFFDGEVQYERPSRIHTMTGNTFKTKVREFRKFRRNGFRNVNIGWAFFVLFLIGTALVAFGFAFPKTFAIFSLVSIFGICPISFLLVQHTPLGKSVRMAKDGSAEESMAFNGAMAPGGLVDSAKGGEAPPRVRQDFPETLYWNPEIVTDERGNFDLPLDLADSITSWRGTMSAVSANGDLGGGRFDIRVFQPFFVDLNTPTHFVLGDQVEMPIVVYNYLQEKQAVKIQLKSADWFESATDEFSLELEPGEVKSHYLKCKFKKVGSFDFEVQATAGKVGDAIRKSIRIRPNGKMVETVYNQSLERKLDQEFELPAGIVPGSGVLFARIQPSAFSQLIDGIEGIFRMPHGCFEQTSSSTYPNVLALRYLRETDQSLPDVEARARQYIHLGYQRLLTFESPGGGFDWYGNAPGNVTLTAYGLREFTDMKEVLDVDQDLNDRTRAWLLGKQNADGSWNEPMPKFRVADAGALADGKLLTTAYVAASVFDGMPSEESRKAAQYILQTSAKEVDNPHILALIVSALNAIDPTEKRIDSYVTELMKMRQKDDSEKTFWSLPQTGQTPFYGRSGTGSIETTAQVVLALYDRNVEPGATRSALSWIANQKRSGGTWGSTQATILALKALLRKPSTSVETKGRSIMIDVNRKSETHVLGADQDEVSTIYELSGLMKSGTNSVQVTDSTKGSGCQLVLRYHLPEPNSDDPKSDTETEEPLSIELEYDAEKLSVNQSVTAKCMVTNRMNRPAQMVMLDLPIPPGFAVDTQSFNEMVKEGTIDKFEVTPRQVIVYLRGLNVAESDGASLNLKYKLRATMPVKVQTPKAQVYEYYNPENKAWSRPIKLSVDMI